jgi:non-specific serine/threonine protein kinase
MRLVHQSLVLAEERVGSVERYRLLEPLRQYGWERLVGRGEADAVQARHLRYYLALAEQAEPQLHGPDQTGWLERLECEHDNLRVALSWCRATGSSPGHEDGAWAADMGVRLAGALWWFWYMRGYLREGRYWLRGALATGVGGRASPIRAKALSGAGVLAHYQGDYEQAAVLCEESLTLARQLGDKAGIAAALHGLAIVARSGGNLAAARAMYEEALPLLRQGGDRWGIAHALQYLGAVLWMQGDYSAARSAIQEGLELYREIGDGPGIGGSLQLLGYVAHSQGDDTEARALCTAALPIVREVSDRRGIGRTLCGLGWAALGQADDAAARASFEEGLVLFGELGDRYFIAWCLEGLAAVTAQGQPRAAARLFGAAATLRAAIGAPLPPSMYGDIEPRLAVAQGQLDEAGFATAWAEGQAMTPEQAIAYAQDQSAPP